ncbi:hypothetical protein [Pseudorhodobacter sp.]|uniref:hypothetical protein n=1 Tax=Pseudorhodobacter sp. TaxID=1934400 RepID=UPI00264A3081|nr:hypothetical protein [Pseudorhodobacter sp.]MDN5786400.1 hypothetical protein [Pseudorhodobacter sp.]
MAYTFPLTLAQFMQILPIREMSFTLGGAVEISETEGGEILTAALGTRLWEGDIFLDDMTRDEAGDVMAMLELLRGSGARFMVYDLARPGPRLDISGVGLASFSPKLLSVSGTTREISLSGLPASYALRRSDYLSFSYGSDPVRYALHRVAAPVSASVGGVTPLFEVSPNIRPGFALNANVTLLKASCKAVVVPGSIQAGRHKATMTTGVSFKFKQTLR